MSLEIGKEFENRARNFLEQQGLAFIDANFRTRAGEIDLIMREGEYIVFVEVRYRKSATFGTALESVTWTKQRKIIRTANIWLACKKIWDKFPIRFDIVAIDGKNHKTEWIPNAFGG